MRFIGVFNRDGGTFKTTDMDAFASKAVELLEARGHTLDPRVVSGKALVAELDRAAQDAEILLAGGGDGTISAAAGVAFKRGVPLAVLPAGTMNLFARSLQMPLDTEEALLAIADGEITRIDIASANGRPFVHQFSVGVHAKLVKLRDALTYRSRIGKILASSRAFVSAISNAPRFYADVTTKTGVERRSMSGILVSNNPLEGSFPHADRLDHGVLGIYMLAPLTPLGVFHLALGAARGTLKGLPEIAEREVREVTLRFPGKKARDVAAIDGELVRLADKVDIKIHPRALQVVKPKVAAEGQLAVPGDDVCAPA